VWKASLGSGGRLGSCWTCCLWPYLWCCSHEVKFAKNAFFGYIALVSLFPILLRCAEVAGGWGGMLGSCGNHHLWVYTPRLVAEVDLMKWARFGHLALVPPFRGLFKGYDMRGTLPRHRGRLGNCSFNCSSAPVVIGPVDGHIGVWARFRSFAQCRGLFLVK
jgi:hypothetical protein